MKLFNNIPRGLFIFIVGILLLIAVAVGYKFLTSGMSSISVGTGNSNPFSALFPFGNNGAAGTKGGGGTPSSPVSAGASGPAPALREVAAGPVSGGWFVPGTTATATPTIRYMLRENGNIIETPADSLTSTRLSNTTVPGIQTLYAAASSTLVLQYLDTTGVLKNAVGTVNTNATEQSLTLTQLPSFNRVAVDANGDLLAVTDENGGAVVERMKADGSKAQTVFTSPILSWVPLAGGGESFVETAPSAAATGYVYKIVSNTLQQVSGGIAGLTASVSPSGRYVAVSGNGADGLLFLVIDTKTGAAALMPVHATTLKCAWIPPDEPLLFCAVTAAMPSGITFPDDWLLGKVALADSAWILNSTKKVSYFVGTLGDASGNGVDVENVSVSSSGTYALFMDKNDLSLWSLNIGDAVQRALGQ
ncbi:MAG: hypothetical protein KGI73_02190 [Patescibacteria group bacterium]|nr:hypothetical protein [Patescibacteria group bacterium]